MSADRPSPKNRLTGVTIADGVLTVPLPLVSTFTDVADTNSMDPCIDIGNKVIMAQANPDDIQPGDIVVAQKSGAYAGTIHRVIRVTRDSHGRLWTTRGDNVFHLPFWRLGDLLATETWRDEDLKWVVVGILY